MNESESDIYIEGLTLSTTDELTKTPVYYVSVIAVNGALLESPLVTSTPVFVVEEDKAGNWLIVECFRGRPF